MDDAYYRAPVGSPEHYTAYEKEFAADDGIGFVFPDDPRASYEVDNAAELAAEAYDEYLFETYAGAHADDFEAGESPWPANGAHQEASEPDIEFEPW